MQYVSRRTTFDQAFYFNWSYPFYSYGFLEAAQELPAQEENLSRETESNPDGYVYTFKPASPVAWLMVLVPSKINYVG